GQGVKAKKSFKKGCLLFRFFGKTRDFQTLYTLQLQKGIYIEDPYFMGRILHSCEPNAYVTMETQEFWALRDIDMGEYITMDYLQTEDKLY
ncbi:SET domain-containing protein-lysine N-methyltransferase, partial [Bacillus thuringiensis]|uniref:SET domain-containing protein-lysine N-methyltransferase n=1 Tax=Bacillus thuringiensis TaxID=1428 RepID=UPI003241C954